jgi:undecaprenyl-phosphate galactose phosphotransferase
MSLVGPRPLTPRELRQHYRENANTVLAVRPGLTGLWQVSGRNALDYRRRVRLDVQLVRMMSPKSYVEMLWKTIPVLFSGDGAW